MHSNYKNNKEWANEMIEEMAEVRSVGQGFAEILPASSGSCSSCSSNTSCSSSVKLFSFLSPTKTELHTLRAQNPVYAKPGDTVVVGVRPNTVLKGSFLAYILPLITLIIFAVLGDILAGYFGVNPELGSILMGLFGLYLGFQILSELFKKSVISHHFEAVILRVVDQQAHPVAFSLSS